MSQLIREYTPSKFKVALSKTKAAFLVPSLISLLLALGVFSLSSCTPNPASGQKIHSLKADYQQRVLNARLTHSAFRKWTQNKYQNSADHTFTFKSHHPDITDSSLKQHPQIISGYSINRLTNRIDGVGLPALIKLKTPEDRIFSPITPNAYLSNLRAVTIVATQTLKKGKLNTHFNIYHPFKDTHNGKPLMRQPNILMEYIQDLPGNSGLDIKGLIRPSKFSNHQGFYLTGPYDKNRIPVIMIHGLVSSPATYAKMADAIHANPELRKKYQIWYYFYPTCTPWLVTSSGFRSSFKTLIKTLDPNENDKNLRNITLIGHSMGGLISRLSLSEPNNFIQEAYFGNTPLDQIFNKQDLKNIRSYFHFKPLTEPSRVIYLATPHRGSRIAQGFIGSITIKLINLPTAIIKQTANTLLTGKLKRANIPEQTKKLLTKGESSINQLQPNNPSLKALNKMQARKDVATHSIIGQIGSPWFKLKTDGVVSHTSSHLHNNIDQVIVPSGHDVCGKKETIDAVIRILSN